MANPEPIVENDQVRVSIIIPHYNQKDCLQRLFPTLVNQTYRDFEVIVIDDCTPDEDTIAYVREFISDKPYMSLVQNEVNLRFIRTCNKGIRLARGEYICLLNSDTVLKDTFIQKNVDILDADPSIGGITCCITEQSGKNWFTGGRYRNGIPSNLHDDFQGLRQVDFIAGTAAFYRKDVFAKVGFFDENYIMYHEDIEFGLRINKFSGYRLCTFSEKLVDHILVPSIPKKEMYYYHGRNLLLISKKYAPLTLPIVMAYLLIFFVASHLVRAFLSVLPINLPFSSARISFAVACIHGAIDGILNRKALP